MSLQSIRRKVRSWTRPGDFRFVLRKGETYILMAAAGCVGAVVGALIL